MLHYPAIDPVALRLGPLSVHWYGLMYLFGMCAAWGLAWWRRAQQTPVWNAEQITDLIFYCAIGLILGGRIGYVLFYGWQFWQVDIWYPLKIWQGGMSFHGGLIGAVIGLYLFCQRVKRPFVQVCDFMVPFVPIGLAAGRLGNFINAELWGRVTTVPWGMVFPNAGPFPRHPSQLYEFLLEGVLLFVILWFYTQRPRPKWAPTALFLLGYGVARFVVEFFRQPDSQLGFVAWGWLTMGQLLSVPMVIFAVLLLCKSHICTTEKGVSNG